MPLGVLGRLNNDSSNVSLHFVDHTKLTRPGHKNSSLSYREQNAPFLPQIEPTAARNTSFLRVYYPWPASAM